MYVTYLLFNHLTPPKLIDLNSKEEKVDFPTLLLTEVLGI